MQFDSLKSSRGLGEAARVVPKNLRKSVPVKFYGHIPEETLKEVNQASPLTELSGTPYARHWAVEGQSITLPAIQITEFPIQNSQLQ